MCTERVLLLLIQGKLCWMCLENFNVNLHTSWAISPNNDLEKLL